MEQAAGGSPKGHQAQGWERSLSPCGQRRGRWVPFSPMDTELRPGWQSNKMAKRRREEVRKGRKLHADHLSKGPRKQLLLELGRMFLNRERGEGASATGKTSQLFATFDFPPQNTITIKHHPFPPSSSPLDWRV